MRTSPPPLLPLFRSQSQVEMLGLLLLQPTREWTLDELATRVRAPVSSVHRELQRAVDAGIVVRSAKQRPHRYSAAQEAPAYEPLRSLLDVTVGVPERLRRALGEVDGVRAAAIHGSWVAGRVRPDSDIDLVVVTDGDRIAVQRAVRAVGKDVGRDVDAAVLTAADFSSMLRSRNPFIERILHNPRIDVVGDLADLAEAQ